MPRHSSTVRLLAALVFLALGAVQLFGVNAGYFCDCNGTAQIVDTAYCVVPHDSDCDTGGHDDHNDGGHKDHDKLSAELQSSPAPTVVISVPAPLMLCILPAPALPPSLAEQAAAKFHADVHGGPPPGLAIERTVVLLL